MWTFQSSKIPRTLALMNVLLSLPPYSKDTAKVLAASDSLDDLDLLTQFGIQERNVVVAGSDPALLEETRRRFKNVSIYEGGIEEAAYKKGRIFTFGIPPKWAAFETISQMTVHGLLNNGHILATLAWTGDVLVDPGFSNMESRIEVRGIVTEDQALEKGVARRVMYLGHRFVSSNSTRAKFNPRAFFFYGARNSTEPLQILAVVRVHRAMPGVKDDRFEKQYYDSLVGQENPLIQVVLPSEEELRASIIRSFESPKHEGLDLPKIFGISRNRVRAWATGVEEPDRNYEEEDMQQAAAIAEQSSSSMLKAALFTKFPESYVWGAIAKKLEKRGIEIARLIPPSSAEAVDLSAADMVLSFIDLANHQETFQIREAAKKYGKKYWGLTRKEATWPADLGRVIENVKQETSETRMAVFSVQDEQLEPFLRDYIALYEAGKTRREMLVPLGKYWSRGALRTPNQLGEYIKDVLHSERCPSFFAEWYPARQVSPKSVQPETEPAMTLTTGPVSVPTCSEVMTVSTEVPEESKTQDAAAELLLYKEEYEQAQRTIRELQVKNIDLTKECETLKSQLATKKKAGSPDLNEVRRSLHVLVDQKLLGQQEAMERFWKYTAKDV